MIIVHAEMPVLLDSKAEVEKRGAQFAAACRSEDGCVSYRLSWEFGEDAMLILIEHWSTLESYRVHTEQPHVKKWAEWVPAHAAGPLRSERYDLEPVEAEES